MLGQSYGQVISSIKKGVGSLRESAAGYSNKVKMGIGARAGAGGIFGNIVGMGIIPGAALGMGSRQIGTGIKKAGGLLSGAFQAHPSLTGATVAGVLGVTGAALSLGTRTLREINSHLRPQGGVGPSMASRGYVSWTSGRSEGMSADHLGASGGLALALHRTRHRLNIHRTGYS